MFCNEYNEIFMNYFIGIDLGTTNTTCIIGKFENGNLSIEKLPIKQLINHPNEKDAIGYTEENKKGKLPSIVLLNGEDQAYTGFYCKNNIDKIVIEEKHTIVKSIKSVIGFDHWKKTVSENRFHTPITITSLILKTVWQSIFEFEKISEEEILGITITIPASFSSKMRTNTLRAISMAGIPLEKVSLLDEPVAAIFSLWNEKSGALTKDITNENILIYDLGGGTIDVSILRLEQDKNNKITKILSTSRYNEIGGDDIDLELSALILKELRSTNKGKNHFGESGTILPYNYALKLIYLAEKLKIKINKALKKAYPNGDLGMGLWDFLEQNNLNQIPPLTIKLKKYFRELGKKELVIPLHSALKTLKKFIHKDYFNKQPEFKNFITPIKQAIARADNINIESIDKIFVVGGGSKFIPITNEIVKLFNRRVLRDLDADFAVSKGATIFSYLKYSKLWKEDQALHDKILIKRNGHPFFEVIKNLPISIPFKNVKVDLLADDYNVTFDQICSSKNYNNKFHIKFFEGSGLSDPFMREIHIEQIEMPYEYILQKPKIASISCSMNNQKVFSFQINWVDEFDQPYTTEVSIDKEKDIKTKIFRKKLPFLVTLNNRKWN